jgi:hypothetical protein
MVATVKFSQFVAGSLANSTNQIVGVTAPSGGTNFKLSFPIVWTTATRPSSPPAGTFGWNTDIGQIEVWNGAAWAALAAGGSGSVNLGSANQLAYYATTGTAVSGLMSANNAVLLTNSSGVPAWAAASANTMLVANASAVPSWSSTLPSGLTITTPNIVGVTDGSNAAAGSVGELISSQVLYASAISLTSVMPANVTSITLDGDFDVWGNVYFPNTGQSYNAGCWISTTSASQPDLSMVNESLASGGATIGISAPQMRINTNTPTVVYLSCIADFISGSISACGGIYARRRR